MTNTTRELETTTGPVTFRGNSISMHALRLSKIWWGMYGHAISCSNPRGRLPFSPHFRVVCRKPLRHQLSDGREKKIVSCSTSVDTDRQLQSTR